MHWGKKYLWRTTRGSNLGNGRYGCCYHIRHRRSYESEDLLEVTKQSKHFFSHNCSEAQQFVLLAAVPLNPPRSCREQILTGEDPGAVFTNTERTLSESREESELSSDLENFSEQLWAGKGQRLSPGSGVKLIPGVGYHAFHHWPKKRLTWAENGQWNPKT